MIQKIRVKLKGFDVQVLDKSVKQIIDSAVSSGAQVVGPIPLPTKIKKYTLNSSPHIDKISMETFEIRIHKRLIEILSPTSKTIDGLTHLQLPVGVGIEIK
ncbi:30S ribosomal protein S10 [Patescibacteria group bacterium]|nr:30S ribosomal protein S10 [Patescibacteria group bacterium]